MTSKRRGPGSAATDPGPVTQPGAPSHEGSRLSYVTTQAPLCPVSRTVWREIPLTKGFVAIVDASDFEWLSDYKWHAGPNGYGVTWVPRPDYHGTQLHMHRMVVERHTGADLDDPESDWWMVVHHINGLPWDNRIANLVAMPREEHYAVHAAMARRLKEAQR